MKRTLLVIAILCLVSTPVFAQFQRNENDQAQGQAQGQIGINRNDNDLTNLQGQAQGQIGINDNQNDNQNNNRNDNENRNTNTNLLNNDQDQDQNQGQGQAQGQGQGQAQGQGQGQAMGQGQVAVGKVGVEVQDNSEYESYSFSPPAIHAQKGTETGNMYSIFGGVGLSTTEEYTVAIETLATIERMQGAGYLTKEEALEQANKVYIEMRQSTQSKRWLGIFGKTRGRHLLNVFGLLSWDSWYKEGQKPFSKSGKWGKEKEEVVPTEKTKEEVVTDTLDDYSGNKGNL